MPCVMSVAILICRSESTPTAYILGLLNGNDDDDYNISGSGGGAADGRRGVNSYGDDDALVEYGSSELDTDDDDGDGLYGDCNISVQPHSSSVEYNSSGWNGRRLHSDRIERSGAGGGLPKAQASW